MHRNKLQFEPLDDYGYLLTWEEFVNAVNCGAFIDYDGFGNYALVDQMTNKMIRPSDIKKGNILHGFTHVMWYNR